LPGEVTRIILRWAPMDTPVAAVTAGQNLYPFDPTLGPGYAWHCHILDHEDNEMMRPYLPVA
jgi:FtsP/CotA-like multicopper oxidase with cupredoxin domain